MVLALVVSFLNATPRWLMMIVIVFFAHFFPYETIAFVLNAIACVVWDSFQLQKNAYEAALKNAKR